MTIWVELRCTGPAKTSNAHAGGKYCPEGHGERGFGLAVSDSHSALKHAYAGLLQQAETNGWQRDTKLLALRCPHCAAAFASADPTEIAGIPFARFVEGVERCIAGEPPSVWGGRDGLPSATQFRNAVNRFPSLRRLYDRAPAFKGGRGKPRAKAVSKAVWEQVIARLKAGETVAAIATGNDGWPTIRQWHGKLAADAGFKAEVAAIRAARKPVRAARPKPSAAAIAARQTEREAQRQAKAKATALLREDRRRQRAEKQAAAKAQRDEQKRHETARRNEEQKREREARRIEKEAERARIAEERRQRRAVEKQAAQEEAKARKQRNRAIIGKQARRFIAGPADKRFDRRLAAPTPEGCRHFIGPIPGTISIGNRQQMTPERAALFFAGIAVPRGYVIEHTCWNDDCFATDHLRPTPAHPMQRPAATIPAEIIDAAAQIVSARFGVGRADLNGTVDRKRGTNHTAFARQVFRYLLTVELEFTQAMVAQAADCDRTTITHGNNLVEDRRDDHLFDQLMDELATALRHSITKMEGSKRHGWPA